MTFAQTVIRLALLACVALALGACGGGDDSAGDETTTEASTTTTEGGGGAEGKTIFVSNCGGCHTLSAAGTSGTTGPNLDDLKPDEETVEEQVKNGGGGMPAFEGKLSDDQIEAVAGYVSSNAGS